MSRATAAAVCRAKAGNSRERTGQAQELLAPGAFQRERSGLDFFRYKSAGYLSKGAKIVQMPLQVVFDAGMVSQPGAQATRPVRAAQVNVTASQEVKGAQPANRQVDCLRQTQEQGIAPPPSRKVADDVRIKRSIPAQLLPLHRQK
jgi:hypothetical protein